MLLKLQNTFYTLDEYGLRLAKIASQGMIMGEGSKRDYKDFSLKNE